MDRPLCEFVYDDCFLLRATNLLLLLVNLLLLLLDGLITDDSIAPAAKQSPLQKK